MGWMAQRLNPSGGKIFSTQPDLQQGPSNLLYSGYSVYFPGVKQPRHGVDHPPSSSAEVKKRVDLCL